MISYLRTLYSKSDKIQIIIFLYSWFFAGIFAMVTGFDRSYDFTNYHIYNPWAFLTNRLIQDIMPACVESYFNPYLDIHHYLAVKYLNNIPYFFQFTEAIFYAFFAVIVYKFCVLFFDNTKLLQRWFSFIIGITPALAIFSISTSSNDLILADLFLLALYFLFRYIDSDRKMYFILSAVIVGLSTVFRLTNGIFVLPVGVALFVVNNGNFYKSFKKSFLWMGLAFLSFLILDGFWLWKIYSIFHNPLFPYFNSFFPSEILNSGVNVLKIDFAQIAPKSLYEYVFCPFLFDRAIDMIGFERGFSDYRMAAFYAVTFYGLVLLFFKKILGHRDVLKGYSDSKYYKFMITFFAVLYPIWVCEFANARYIIPVFALGGCMLFYFMDVYLPVVVKSKKKICLSYIFVFLFLFFTTNLPSFEDRMPIPDAQYKILYAQDAKFPDDSYVIVQCSHAFIAMFQNPKAHYVYLNNPRFTEMNAYVFSDKYIEQIKEKLTNHKVYFVYSTTAVVNDYFKKLTKALNRYIPKNEYTFDQCRLLDSNVSVNSYVVCDFKKRK